MPTIYNVTLELLRPGPAHNQLLSPLTPYIALCGADGPVTVTIPFEQRHLLSRLSRLRYAVDGQAIPTEQREGEVHEIGEILGRVLAAVPSLLFELGNARLPEGCLVHLRLSMSPFELAMVPFEFAIGSDGFPASGSPLLLQARAPITITREVRRGQPLPLVWNRKPRILFAFASPDGFPAVPAQDHLNGLRRAIEPWVRCKLDINGDPDPEERIKEVETILTVLPEATLAKLRAKCESEEFTHVHILAHGAEFPRQNDQHYGIALCDENDPRKPSVIDGDSLARAVTANESAARRPTLVSLATCDSSNVKSVVTTGGSITHALHVRDVPWVIGSQFPLWMRASSIATEVLYTGLMEGEDPRRVLYTLRQRLRTGSPRTHDWASICAYATIPADLEEQVAAFHERQTRAKMEVKFDKAEQIIVRARERGTEALAGIRPQLEELYDSIRSDLDAWYMRLPSSAPAYLKAEVMGMKAAAEKRIGGLRYRIDGELSKSVRQAYARARDLYRKALELQPLSHWVITQHLSMQAVLAATDTTFDREVWYWWIAARQIAEWQLAEAQGEQKAWALGTLAELQLLGSVLDKGNFDRDSTRKEIERACIAIAATVGFDAFAVKSTRRQFTRYLEEWKRPDDWGDLAQVAVDALRGPYGS
jgi:hypothetical protein